MTQSIAGYTALKSNRYERKFSIDHLRPEAVETLVRNHPALFHEVYAQRHVNNIYLDTHGMMHYHDNVVGRSRRQKARIRWYGGLHGRIEHPILEIKIKNGMTGTKKSFPLPSFSFERSMLSSDLADLIRSASDLPEEVTENVKSLTPTLVNRYARKYYLDHSKAFRLTIDTDLQYFGVLGQSLVPDVLRKEEGAVVEVKYEMDVNEDAGRITNVFPFRMTKNSKYVNGIDLCRRVIH